MLSQHTTPELQCKKCGDWRILSFKNHTFTRGGIQLFIRNGPILKCPRCGHQKALAKSTKCKARPFKRLTRITKSGFAVVTVRYDSFSGNHFPVIDLEVVNRLKEKKKRRGTITPMIPRQKFNFCHVPFIYDARDYYYLPGLYRWSNDGYLTPVFFNSNVLLKYAHHPDCALDFASDTYGTIQTADGKTTAFGINRSGCVIMWLGDIDRLSDSEQHYLVSENVESDHDVGSHFYAGQIDVEFTPPSMEKALLTERHKTVILVFEKLVIKLAHLDLEVIDVLRKIRRPIVWNENSVGQSIENLNKALIETINANAIKRDLNRINSKLDLSEVKSVKLFEKWLEMRCAFGNAADLVQPLFVLYDLRLLSAHLLSNRKKKKLLASACKRLGLEVNTSNVKEIYVQLVEALTKMYAEIHSKITSL